MLLTMEPNADKTGVVFGVQDDVPRAAGSAAQQQEHDKALGAGTMSRSGATCPCCGAIMTQRDIRLEGMPARAGRGDDRRGGGWDQRARSTGCR